MSASLVGSEMCIRDRLCLQMLCGVDQGFGMVMPASFACTRVLWAHSSCGGASLLMHEEASPLQWLSEPTISLQSILHCPRHRLDPQ
eukprot:11777258-Alexandrium_andersonii.AAC.1